MTTKFEINGTTITALISRGRINSRADFSSLASAAGFRDGIVSKGFEPRLLDNEDGTYIVAFSATAREVLAALD